MKKIFRTILGTSVVLACAFAFISCKSKTPEAVRDKSNVQVKGNSYGFSKVECDDVSVKSEYNLALQGSTFTFVDDGNGIFKVNEEETEFIYSIVTYADGDCGFQLKGEHGMLGLSVNGVDVPSSWDYMTDGSITSTLNSDGVYIYLYYDKV